MYTSVADSLYNRIIINTSLVYLYVHISGWFMIMSWASQDRPNGVFHPNFINGKPTYFILTVHNSLQPGIINLSWDVAGLQGEQSKYIKYARPVQKAGGEIVPLAVETLWTPCARKILSPNSG